MKYMLLVYFDECVMQGADHSECLTQAEEILKDINVKGQLVSAAPLYPTATATSVRLRNGKRLVTDGPFAETHEQIGGYYLIDVADLDEAINIAARTPMAGIGTVEIRPIVEPLAVGGMLPE